MTSAIGLTLSAAAHHFGWPVAVGGSSSIAQAMMRLLEELGGRVETGIRVDSLRDLGNPDVVLLDTSPAAAVKILDKQLPARIARAYSRYRHGPGAFQIALAVEDGIPWRSAVTRQAGTVHLGGDFAEIAAAERAVWAGHMPERPFVLLGQQYLADASRSVGNVHPVEAYAHVPSGWTGDATEAILEQIERFAPGVRERIVSVTARSTGQIAASNANFLGGDITTGANTGR